jgi:hypothetical protein
MSADPSNAPPISIRRRGLIAPTQALAPSPTASLTALVQSGRDVPAIAEALGVTPDEARARLDGIGLLDVVEPPAPAPATLADLLAPAPAVEEPRSAAPAPAPAPITTSPSPAPVPAAAPVHEAPSASDESGGDGPRRGRKPGRPSAATPSSTGFGAGYFAGVYGAADYEALGRLYARALEEGTTVESIVATARALVELADRLRLR